MTPLTAGARVKRRYTVQDVVGQGSMAGVYRVIDDVSGAVWALKEMSLEGLAPDEAAETQALALRLGMRLVYANHEEITTTRGECMPGIYEIPLKEFF